MSIAAVFWAIRSRRDSGRRPVRARFRLEGLEERKLLSGVAGYTEYPVSGGEVLAHITTGPDGNIWFTEFGGRGADLVGMFNPTTHAVTQFTSPSGSTAPIGLTQAGITAGPDGNIWFTEYNASKLGMINTTTHAVTEFSLPSGYSHPMDVTKGSDGNLWFTVLGAVGSFNPTTHVFNMTTVAGSYYLHGITAGPNGNLWFTDYANGSNANGEIGEINPNTHAVTEFQLPVAGPHPWGIAAGADGNIWFISEGANVVAGIGVAGEVGSVNPATGAIVMHSISGIGYGIAAGPDGNLWFGGTLGEANLTTGGLTQFPVETGTYGYLATGPDGNLWFTAGSALGVATLSPIETDLVMTQPPPSSVAAGAGFGLTVTAEDASGNVVTSFNGAVTVALDFNPKDAGTLGGTLTATAVNGVATFSGLTLTTVANGYTLIASTSGLDGLGLTNDFSVTPGAPALLQITTEPPSSVGHGKGFGFIVTITDAYGNVETSDNATITATLGANPGGATLGGTKSVQAQNGVATFSGLTISKAGKGYTLVAQSAGLKSATSTAINVT